MTPDSKTLYPTSTEEASAMLRDAAAQGLTVLPRGGGSRLNWGNPVTGCDLIVDTTRMDRVIEHAAGDLVARVQAGARMGSVASVLAEAGQEIALDVPPDATAGGVIATGLTGPRRLRYGSPRDLVIGITVVRADGTVARSGGKVVKNVAGYDLGKLFAGSAGTLGLITEAVFRLHPLPAARSYVTAAYPSSSDAARAVAAASGSALNPSAVELRRGPAPDGPVGVGVELEGSVSGVSSRSDDMASLLSSGGTTSRTRGTAVSVSSEKPAWWLAGKRVPEGGTLIAVSFWVSALESVLDTVAASASSLSLTPVVNGSAGAGIIHVGLGPSADPAVAGRFVAALRAELAHARGSVVVLTAPEPVRKALADHGGMTGPLPSLRLMKAVRDQFDPEHRMSPGRFFDDSEGA